MPNWVYNSIAASEKVLKDMLKEDGHVTFQKIVPMPEGLSNRGTDPKIMSQEEIDECWRNYEQSKASGNLSFDQGYPQNLGITQEENDRLYSEYGCNNWKDWAIKYWGCKWDGASDEPYDDDNFSSLNQVSFRTAWDHPLPFIKELSKKHPEELISVHWEEEQGYGQIYNILNTKVTTHEAWDLPEFEEVDEINGQTIYKCVCDGGRYEEHTPLFKDGCYYIDQDQDQEYQTLEEVKKVLEE